MLSILWAMSAMAYETDPLTPRLAPPSDSGAEADAHMNALIDEAVARTNAETQCGLEFDSANRHFAAHLHRMTAPRERVPDRGLWKGLGYGRLAAWFETAPIARSEVWSSSIYDDIPINHSLILSIVGPASIVNLHGTLVGTDKIDHFVATGYRYLHMPDAEAAERLGHRLESTFHGLMTSNAYSYADLEANEAGMRFYAEGAGGTVAVDGATGCLVRTGEFTWADWVEPSWDEYLNPPVFTNRAGKALDESLEEKLGALCAVEWPHEVQDQPDPWRMAERCADVSVTAPLPTDRPRARRTEAKTRRNSA